MLLIFATLGALAIALAVVIGAGVVRLAAADPFANVPTPTAAPSSAAAGTATDATPELDSAESAAPPPPPPLLSDRAIMLTADRATLAGPNAAMTDTTFSGEKSSSRKEGRRKRGDDGKRVVSALVTRLATPQDAAEWTFTVPEGGAYSVTLDYSTSGREKAAAPDRYTVAAGGQSFTADVGPTRGASAFQLIDLGTITLAQGEARLTFRPEAKVDGGTLYIRGLRLFPAD